MENKDAPDLNRPEAPSGLSAVRGASQPNLPPIPVRTPVPALPPIPGVEPLLGSHENGHDPEVKAPEIERSLDRAKENLVAYIGERVPNFDREMIQKAVDFSMMAHKNQFRRSGMPYAEHPFEVAKVLADLGMDGVTIVAGLLHDVVEDTHHPVSEVKELFGEDVAFLVEAVTKISAIKSKSRAEQQAETFRKMLISMAKDIRVIMIKFADRLHNMRTLTYMKDDRKRAIAAETIEVYAPLAHRFGLARIKWELEDLAFKYLNPDAYKNLVKKVVERRQEREEYIRGILGPVKDALKKAGIEGKVFGRPKHLHSIWEKMQARQCAFEDIYDLYALRVVVKTVGDCYAVLGLVHSLWTPLQSRFKDYIATPKSNLYQSLHTTLIGPGGKPVEIQIRTDEMDLIAEQGIAAHWGYKETISPKELGKENKWLKQFLEWQQDLTDSHEFMEYFRGDLATGEIFVFTPQGDLVQLPKGATALDFAFALHSGLGLHCIGAKVDGNVAPLYRELRTGERVEILKSDSQRPSKDWLSIVTTTKAKSAIRRWMRTEEVAHSMQLGKEMLEREFRQSHIPKEIQEDLAPFQIKFGVTAWEALWEKLGHGEITLGALSTVRPGPQSQPQEAGRAGAPLPEAAAPERAGVGAGLGDEQHAHPPGHLLPSGARRPDHRLRDPRPRGVHPPLQLPRGHPPHEGRGAHHPGAMEDRGQPGLRGGRRDFRQGPARSPARHHRRVLQVPHQRAARLHRHGAGPGPQPLPHPGRRPRAARDHPVQAEEAEGNHLRDAPPVRDLTHEPRLRRSRPARRHRDRRRDRAPAPPGRRPRAVPGRTSGGSGRGRMDIAALCRRLPHLGRGAWPNRRGLGPRAAAGWDCRETWARPRSTICCNTWPSAARAASSSSPADGAPAASSSPRGKSGRPPTAARRAWRRHSC